MTKALRSSFPDLFPVRTPQPLWLQYTRRFIRKATGGQVDIAWISSLAKWNANQLTARLKMERVDVVVSIGASPLCAHIARWFPTIHVSDATVPLMRDYYLEFSALPKFLADSARRLDCASVRLSRACLFSTNWAANSAIWDYGADPARVHVIPWGANVDAIEPFDYESSFHNEVCHLVFIGVDWKRKGGDIAVAAALRLSEGNHAVKLHIVGATPANLRENTGDAIVIHGFINKGSQEGRDRFNAIMKQAAFLFVPSRQDCSPMVFAEANSYGIPVITTSTGGVPDVVREGINGHMLPIEGTADEYAKLIWTIWSDRERYRRLRESSRRRFGDILNWDSWRAHATEVIERVALKQQNESGS